MVGDFDQALSSSFEGSGADFYWFCPPGLPCFSGKHSDPLQELHMAWTEVWLRAGQGPMSSLPITPSPSPDGHRVCEMAVLFLFGLQIGMTQAQRCWVTIFHRSRKIRSQKSVFPNSTHSGVHSTSAPATASGRAVTEQIEKDRVSMSVSFQQRGL